MFVELFTSPKGEEVGLAVTMLLILNRDINEIGQSKNKTSFLAAEFCNCWSDRYRLTCTHVIVMGTLQHRQFPQRNT